MTTLTKSPWTSNSAQAFAGLGAFLAIVLHSAMLSENDQDSVLGVGRVIIAALIYSLILSHVLKGYAEPDSPIMSSWISALVVTEVVFAVVVLAAVFFGALPGLATAWVNIAGLALLVGHLTVVILRSQRSPARQ